MEDIMTSTRQLPEGMDIEGLMRQAQQMQEELQREMQKLRAEASAGGGIVRVVMNGAKEVVQLKIEPDIVKGGDVEMLEDLIIAAVNEAARKVDEAVKSKIGAKLGGLGLLGGLL
jgi:DNA-binding YbaB/EbfC family protein